MNEQPTQNTPAISSSAATVPTPQINIPNKKSHTGLIIGIVAGVVLFGLIICGILAAMVSVSLTSAKDKAKDARIKGDVAQARMVMENGFADHNQYAMPTTTDSSYIQIKQDIEQMGSKLVIQGLSKETYVVYASLPSSKKIYCADATGQTIELNAISPTATLCK